MPGFEGTEKDCGLWSPHSQKEKREPHIDIIHALGGINFLVLRLVIFLSSSSFILLLSPPILFFPSFSVLSP
jgi:hypothetical protein